MQKTKLNKKQLLFYFIIINLCAWILVIMLANPRTRPFPTFNLKNIFNNEKVDLSFLNAELNIIVFFSLDDCAMCLYEAGYWANINHIFRTSEVKIIGITVDKDIERMKSFISEYKIHFPILLDFDHSVIIKVLKIPLVSKEASSTPFKVFLNNKREIIKVEKASKTSEEQSHFIERIVDLIGVKRELGK